MKKTSKFKSSYKTLFLVIILMIMTAQFSISATQSFIYVITNGATHGDEIDNFKLYTLEQCRQDEAKN